MKHDSDVGPSPSPSTDNNHPNKQLAAINIVHRIHHSTHIPTITYRLVDQVCLTHQTDQTKCGIVSIQSHNPKEESVGKRHRWDIPQQFPSLRQYLCQNAASIVRVLTVTCFIAEALMLEQCAETNAEWNLRVLLTDLMDKVVTAFISCSHRTPARPCCGGESVPIAS